MNSYLGILFCSIFLISFQKEPKFEPQVVDDHLAIGYGLAIGDVDGDSKPDILLADKKQFVWYRNGDWKRFVMVDNLTESDNVCIAARDIDGDGKVEVAVGAQWNPSETTDPLKSGSVHFLIRPNDATQRWTPVELHHEPTVHRMRWVKSVGSKYHLIVVPLHGRGNKNGEGVPVNVIAYEMPENPNAPWKHWVIDQSMHLTHNLDVVKDGAHELIYIGGKEGIKVLAFEKGKWLPASSAGWFVQGESFGEVRVGDSKNLVAGIQPMHGNQLVVYTGQANRTRNVLTTSLNQGHALATADLLGLGNDQVIVGWREPDEEKKIGIRIFNYDTQTKQWENLWIDNNGIACEDLQVYDLDGDGKMDIIAAGRSTHNLKIYWNKN